VVPNGTSVPLRQLAGPRRCDCAYQAQTPKPSLLSTWQVLPQDFEQQIDIYVSSREHGPVALPVALPLEGTQSLRAKGQGNRERRCFTQSATHTDRAPCNSTMDLAPQWCLSWELPKGHVSLLSPLIRNQILFLDDFGHPSCCLANHLWTMCIMTPGIVELLVFLRVR
jgi:hypothetical protein